MTNDQRPDALLTRISEGIALPLTWSNSAAIASYADGYALAAKFGISDLGAWANQRLGEALRNGSWAGGPVELWLNLYFEHRRWRHFADIPGGLDLERLDDLCTALQLAIVESEPQWGQRTC